MMSIFLVINLIETFYYRSGRNCLSRKCHNNWLWPISANFSTFWLLPFLPSFLLKFRTPTSLFCCKNVNCDAYNYYALLEWDRSHEESRFVGNFLDIMLLPLGQFPIEFKTVISCLMICHHHKFKLMKFKITTYYEISYIGMNFNRKSTFFAMVPIWRDAYYNDFCSTLSWRFANPCHNNLGSHSILVKMTFVSLRGEDNSLTAKLSLVVFYTGP